MNRRDLIRSAGAVAVAAASVRPIFARMGRGGVGPAINNEALGFNLNQPTYFSPEQPFLNIVLNNAISAAYIARGGGEDGWLTSTYGAYTGTVDANGWPTEIQDGVQNQFLILRNLPQANGGTGARYRSGTYYVLYNGTGTVTYSFDATRTAHASGSAYGFDWMDTLNVATPSTAGIQVNVTATSASPNNIRDIAVVHSSDLAAWASGEMFSPSFISRVQTLGPIRTMDWRSTNVVTWIKDWTDEPIPTQGGFSDCVPWTIIVRLANEANVPALWVNIPMNATVAYVTALMNYLAANLKPGIEVLVQYANEVWTGLSVVGANALANGKALWANWATFGTTSTMLSYEGYILQQACNAAVTAFGSANVGPGKRVQVIAGAQYTNGGILDLVMTTPAAVGNGGQALYGNFPIAGCAVGWYFNITPGTVPASWLTKSPSQFIADCNTEFTTGGLIPNHTTSGLGQYTGVIDYITNQMATKYGGLACYGYEGGSGITPNGEFNQLFGNAGTSIARSTAYGVNHYGIDANNGLYIVTVSGTTAASAPAFNNTLGGLTTDGGVTWMRVQSATVGWVAAWTPLLGDVVKDSNGNFQVAITVTGPTGASAPTWGTTPLSPTAAGSQTTDGGVTWLCIRDDSWTALESDYAQSPQIASAYATCMNYWKGKGSACRYFFQFNDCFPYSKFGLWGATESFLDTVLPLSSAPQKWQAIASWAPANPKWW